MNEAAFGTPLEADIVDALRITGRLAVSLVAAVGGAVVGHIAFSPVTIDGDSAVAAAPTDMLALGPMAVLPAEQRKGIGTALVRAGLRRCGDLGARGVVVVGHPEYYPHFGFEPAARRGLRCELDVPDDVFMVLELRAGALRDVAGTVRFDRAFDAAASRTPEATPPLDAFASAARAFCAWVRGEATLDAPTALRHLALLYSAALQLPQPFSAELDPDEDAPPVPIASLHRVRERVSTLPFRHYWQIYEPIDGTPDEPVAGDLHGDVEEIYSDVACGLALLDEGKRAEALWEWGFNFRIHWGEHAVCAMRALHGYLSEHDPDGLSR